MKLSETDRLLDLEAEVVRHIGGPVLSLDVTERLLQSFRNGVQLNAKGGLTVAVCGLSVGGITRRETALFAMSKLGSGGNYCGVAGFNDGEKLGLVMRNPRVLSGLLGDGLSPSYGFDWDRLLDLFEGSMCGYGAESSSRKMAIRRWGDIFRCLQIVEESVDRGLPVVVASGRTDRLERILRDGEPVNIPSKVVMWEWRERFSYIVGEMVNIGETAEARRRRRSGRRNL